MDTPKPRILVVEDEYLIAEALKDYLTELGCDCIGPASSLKAGIELVQTGPVDAAILDVRLGIDRVDTLAGLLSARGVPFAFASGDSEGLNEKWPKVPSVTKPFTDGSLREVLGKLIELPLALAR